MRLLGAENKSWLSPAVSAHSSFSGQIIGFCRVPHFSMCTISIGVLRCVFFVGSELQMCQVERGVLPEMGSTGDNLVSWLLGTVSTIAFKILFYLPSLSLICSSRAPWGSQCALGNSGMRICCSTFLLQSSWDPAGLPNHRLPTYLLSSSPNSVLCLLLPSLFLVF